MEADGEAVVSVAPDEASTVPFGHLTLAFGIICGPRARPPRFIATLGHDARRSGVGCPAAPPLLS